MSFGRLERTRGPEPFSSINVTPLVDVMLVLVVIFIITAPLLASSLQLDLPAAGAATPSRAPARLTLAIDAAGTVQLEGRAVDPPALARGLSEAARRDPDTELQLRADRAVPYGKIIELMSAAQQAGLTRIGFVADAGAR